MANALPPKDLYCHRTGFTKKCLGLVSSGKCQGRWLTLEGNDPVSGEHFAQSDCADNWPVILLIDIAKKIANGTGATQAAVEDFRNRMMELNSPTNHTSLPKN
jgi:hypothetical protein